MCDLGDFLLLLHGNTQRDCYYQLHEKIFFINNINFKNM